MDSATMLPSSSSAAAFGAPPAGPVLTRRLWLFALVAAVLACLVRVAFAEQRGFWLDEYFTLRAAKMDLADMVKERIRAGHSPLYFFYARLGLLFGSGERALRLTSALAAGALVLLLTGLMGELRLTRYLPWLWALAIVEPYWMSIGMEYRYTMPLVAVAAAVAWAAAWYADAPRPARGAVLALAVALVLWTHGSAPFFVIGLLGFLLWDGAATLRAAGNSFRSAFGRALLRAWPVAAGLLASVPFYMLVRNHPSEFEENPARFKEVMKDLIDVVFGYHRLWFHHFDWPHHTWLFNLEIAVLVGAILLAGLELRRWGNRRAWRLLASIMIAIPLFMFLFCISVRNFQGPVRYMATFTIPAVICLAIAARAALHDRWIRWLYIAGLLTVQVFQSSAMTLDRGDRHRDAIRWVIENHTGKDPIMMAVAMNGNALRFYGLETKGFSLTGYDTNLKKTTARIKKQLAGVRRGLLIRYHSSAKILEAVEDLQKSGFLAGQRIWCVGGRLYVGAFARDPKELPWLNKLQPPHRDWGPAQADD